MQKILILGATSGIGREIARIYAANGHQVIAAGRRISLLEELQNEFPDNIHIYTADISKIETINSHLNKMANRLNGIDILILSSGIGKRNSELNPEQELLTVDTNVAGFTAVTGWAFHYFQKQNHGHIVATSSIAGLRGNRFAPAYGASKAFNINYLQALRQLAHHQKLNITISDIRPGFVDTAMSQGEGVFWSAPAHKAALQIVKLIDRKKEIIYITKRWRYIAFLIQLIPRFIFERI